jgi:hypothetical protein
MNSKELRDARRYLHEENKKHTVQLSPVPKDLWPKTDNQNRIALFRSKEFVVQVVDEGKGAIRLSVNRSEIANDGNWKEGITWDELQRLKSEAGYGDKDAVELFPADGTVINVANMRHLWILPESPAWKWKAAE